MIVGYCDLRDLAPHELDLLPGDERIREFGAASRQRQFRCGRALVRLLLAEVTGRPAGEHVIVAEEGGKPVCEDGPAISITHSAATVACCVAGAGRAGIDIERIDDRRDTARIVDRFFSREESSWLASNPDGFYMLWVLKEAFVKAHGQSIFGGLEKLRCTVDAPAIEAVALAGGFRDLNLYRRDDTFLGLATTEEGMSDVDFRYWSPQTGVLEPGTDYRLVASTAKGSES